MENEILGWLAYYTGVGLGLSGSAWGLAIAFSAALATDQKKFFAIIPLVVLPSTQGIYTLVGAILKRPAVEANPSVGGILLLLGLACLISGIFQGKVCAAGVRAINEEKNTLGNGIISAAMVETYAVFGFVCLFLLA